MSPRFLAMMPFIFEWEGVVYENDPDDPGGATKFGIDQRSHPKEDIRNLTAERARQIYWETYWEKNGCEEKEKPLGEVYFNACVNCGWGRAAKLLSASGGSPSRYLEEQAAFYRGIVSARPKSQKYLKGWMNRVNSLKQLLKIQ